jgi:hypothetical protein
VHFPAANIVETYVENHDLYYEMNKVTDLIGFDPTMTLIHDI